MFLILDEVRATPVLDYVKKNQRELIHSPTLDINSMRLASSDVASRDLAASTVLQTTKTDDLLKNTEIQKIVA
jgi:hypothetical protein